MKVNKNLNTMESFKEGFKIERDGKIYTLTQGEMFDFRFLDNALDGQGCLSNFECCCDTYGDEAKICQDLMDDEEVCYNLAQDFMSNILKDTGDIEYDLCEKYIKNNKADYVEKNKEYIKQSMQKQFTDDYNIKNESLISELANNAYKIYLEDKETFKNESVKLAYKNWADYCKQQDYYFVYDIDWDVDDKNVLKSLSAKKAIPESIEKNMVADYLFEHYGFCAKSFRILPKSDKEECSKTSKQIADKNFAIQRDGKKYVLTSQELTEANAVFIKNFMGKQICELYGIEDTDTISALANLAYEEYCEGNGKTEGECIEDTYNEWKESQRHKGYKNILNIKWDVDDKKDLDILPSEVWIPKTVDDDEVADYLSDNYGFCVKSFLIASKDNESEEK